MLQMLVDLKLKSRFILMLNSLVNLHGKFYVYLTFGKLCYCSAKIGIPWTKSFEGYKLNFVMPN